MTAWVSDSRGAALAVALELLEAMAIVLAVGVSRRWRDAVIGAVAAVVVLAVVAALVGPVLLAALPLALLQTVVGVALLLFGLEWLRKGVLRLAGRRAPSDSLKEYLEEREAMEALPPPAPGQPDWPARVVAFKGVALEGLEVVLIVAALAAGGDVAPALVGSAVAVLVVLAIGIVVHRPLARLPESHLKYAVGLLLTSFGVFFLAEGIDVEWPGGDLALVYVALALAARLATAGAQGGDGVKTLRKLVFGETWTVPIGVALTLAVGAAAARRRAGGSDSSSSPARFLRCWRRCAEYPEARMSALIEARESLDYWEQRAHTLPRLAVRKRREAREMAARWRERVSEVERMEYGAGLLGAVFMVLAERRLPVTTRHTGRTLVKAALWTAVVTTVLIVLLVVALFAAAVALVV